MTCQGKECQINARNGKETQDMSRKGMVYQGKEWPS
jgi:hypothetical protein